MREYVRKLRPNMIFMSAMICFENKRLNLEEPFLAHKCMLTKQVRLQICIQIVNAMDLYFQCQRFVSTKLGSSYVMISRRGDRKDKHCYRQKNRT